jgi:hypothetical protein
VEVPSGTFRAEDHLISLASYTTHNDSVSDETTDGYATTKRIRAVALIQFEKKNNAIHLPTTRLISSDGFQYIVTNSALI